MHVVYNNDQAYPRYVLTYTGTPGSNSDECAAARQTLCDIGCDMTLTRWAPPPPPPLPPWSFVNPVPETEDSGRFGAAADGVLVDSVSGVCCSKGHPLVSFSTPTSSFTCDKCGSSQSSGTTMHGCRQCNYDLCLACVPAGGGPIAVGSKVRVKLSVSKPSHGWGTVKPGDVGTVRALGGNGGCTIDFPSQSGWSGKVNELEAIGPSGAVTESSKAIGLRVKRGPGWKWNNQDQGGMGTINKLDSTGWVGVKWDHGGTNSYRTTQPDLVFCGADPVAAATAGAAAASGAAASSSALVVGSQVRVKPSVGKPQYGWGSVSPGDTGTVTAITGSKVTVKFPTQSSWSGALSEMEVVFVGGSGGAVLTHANASIGLRVHTTTSHSGKTGDGTLLGWKHSGSRSGDTSGGLSSDGYCRVDFDSGGPWNVSACALCSAARGDELVFVGGEFSHSLSRAPLPRITPAHHARAGPDVLMYYS